MSYNPIFNDSGDDDTKALMSDGAGGFVMATPAGGTTLEGSLGQFDRRTFIAQSNCDSNGFNQRGYLDWVESGTQTHDLSFGTDFATAATTGSVGGFQSSSDACVATGGRVIMSARIQTGSTNTTVRYAVGLCSSGTSFDSSATPSAQFMAIRYDTTTDGTAFWRCITSSGGGNITTTTTSVAIGNDTDYRAILDARDPASIKFYLSSGASSTPVLVATHTTFLPSTSQGLVTLARCVALDNAARSIRIRRLYVEAD